MSACSIEIEFDDKETRHTVEIQKPNGEPEKLFLFVGDDAVTGKVHIKIPEGKKIEHTGIKMELIGQIELFYDRGRHFIFTTLLNDFAEAGILSGNVTYPFVFANLEKSHESYNGINVRLRYLLRCTISRSLLTNITKEQDFWVYSYGKPPEVNSSIKMEVGIEDCLHIEFEYNKSKYHLKDVIIGKIFFLLVRIKIKYMEISVIRRESTGSGPNLFNENETLTKFEIMDGAPVRGESIPVRMFLAPVELSPTYKNVHSKFSVRYFLNLVLVDEDDRRYFKQQEIVMWRKPPKKLKKKETTEAHKKIAQIQDESTNGNKPIQEPKPAPVEAQQQDLL